MYCQECGTKNIDSSLYCKHCGNSIRASLEVAINNPAIIQNENIISNAIKTVTSKADNLLKEIKKDSNSEELLRWHELYLKGVLTETEFNEKKKELI